MDGLKKALLGVMLILLLSGAHAALTLKITPDSYAAPLEVSKGASSFSAQFGNDAVAVNECIILNGLRTDISNLTSKQKADMGFDKDFTTITKVGAGYKIAHSFIEPSIAGTSINNFCWLVDSPTAKITEKDKALYFGNPNNFIDWSAEDGNGMAITFEKYGDYSYAVYGDLSKKQNQAILIDPLVSDASAALSTALPFSKVARASDGNIGITWQDGTNTYFSTSRDGNGWGTLTLFAGGTTGAQTIDTNSTNGWIIATENAATGSVQAMSCSKDCNVAAGNWITSNAQAGIKPSLKVSSDNNAHIAFLSSSILKYTQCANTGASCSSAINVATGGSHAKASIDINSTGGLGIVDRNVGTIRFSECSKDCNSAGNWKGVDLNTGNDPAIASTPDGNWVITYSNGTDIIYERCAKNCSVAANWTDAFNVSSTGTAPYSTLAIDANNTTYVFWDDTNGIAAGYALFWRRRFADNTWDTNAMWKRDDAGAHINNTAGATYPNARRRAAWGSAGLNNVDLVYIKGALGDFNIWFDSNGVGTVGGTAPPSGYDANFLYVPIPPTGLNPDAGALTSIVNFYDKSINTTAENINDWNWFDNNIIFNTVDANTSRTYAVQADHNICLRIRGDLGTEDITCGKMRVGEYPQDVNFTWSPTLPSAYQDVNFYADANKDNNITRWFWNFGDGNTMYGEDVNHQFTKGGAKTVCLIVQADRDLNTTVCNTVLLYGSLNMQFRDENTLAPIASTIIDFNGNSYTSSGNGDFNYPLGTLAQDGNVILTVTASKAGYGARYFQLDLNRYVQYDINALLLADINGYDVKFKYYKPNGADLCVSCRVIAKRKGAPTDTNYAGIRYTDLGGEVSFFLNKKDANSWDFNITDSSGNKFKYGAGSLTIKVPLDAKTLIGVNPYNFKFGLNNTGDLNIGGAVADYNSIMFYTNTKEFYMAQVDANASGYMPSGYYLVTLLGDGNSYTLQPYLVHSSYGYLVTITLVNSDYTRVANAAVELWKDGALQGSGITDGKGEVILPMIDAQRYQIKVYKGLELLVDLPVTANGYFLYVYVDTKSTDYSIPGSAFVRMTVTPSTASTTDTIEIKIIPLENAVGRINWIRIWITQKDVNMTFTPNCIAPVVCAAVPGTFVFITDAAQLKNGARILIASSSIPGLDTREILHVRIFANITGFSEFGDDHSISYANLGGFNVLASLRGEFKTDVFGCQNNPILPCGPTLLISIIATMCAVIFVKLRFTGAPVTSLAFLAAVMIIFFAYIDWVPLWIAGFAIMGAAGIIYYNWKG